MTQTLGVMLATLAVFGVVLIVWSLTGVVNDPQPGTRSSTGLWTKVVDKFHGLGRRDIITLSAGVLLGVAAAWYLAMPLMLVLVPLAVWGLPRLLSEPAQTDIALLQALDRWIRVMTATLSTGKSITDAIRLSVRQAPPLISEPLFRLVKRLDDRWPTGQALFAMADDLDSADADAVIAALILSVQRGGSGAAATLAALADSIQERLKALREIEAERAKPRIVVKQVTVITVVLLGLAMTFVSSYFEPFTTPLGQVILSALIAAYVVSLLALRRMTLPRRRGRILRSVS